MTHPTMFRNAACAFVLGVSALSAHAESFTLSSQDIVAGGTLAQRFEFDGFGCKGQNQSPALQWRGAPAGTQSYAVTVYDPDAPTGSGWWHWMVYNIPASVQSLPANAGALGGANLPAGAVQHRTDFGNAAFGGACPPAGDKPHRYVFTVYALKTPKLEVPADGTAALAGFMIHGSMLGKASFAATYERPPVQP